jgi:pyruvate formate lyase activating enzyme
LRVQGTIFNIQRFSLHDGPGIRTSVFLKGCSLRCFWCHNPEGLRLQPEVQFFAERCLGDGDCERACPAGAHTFVAGEHLFDRARCDACGRCLTACAAEALELTGRRVTVDEIMPEILADRPFYASSGGGVTLTGGDPLLQPAFTQALLERCRVAGLHTALEITGNCPWEQLESLLPSTDLIMLDLKHMDDARHRQATGAGNGRILANARRLAERGVALILRVPIVPGVNDDEANLVATAQFVRMLGELGAAHGHYLDARPWLELLPFHRLAGHKYRSLGQEDRAQGIQPPSRDRMDELSDLARSRGIQVRHR